MVVPCQFSDIMGTFSINGRYIMCRWWV